MDIMTVIVLSGAFGVVFGIVTGALVIIATNYFK